MLENVFLFFFSNLDERPFHITEMMYVSVMSQSGFQLHKPKVCSQGPLRFIPKPLFHHMWSICSAQFTSNCYRVQLAEKIIQI